MNTIRAMGLMVSFFGAVFLSGRAVGQTPARPGLIADAADLAARIKTELRVTRPDYVVFVPEIKSGAVSDTGNEHFLVFDGPDGSLMAVWTQSSAEAQPDQHIVFARSPDEGITWTKPRIIAGPRKAGDGFMASWGYPLVSRSGRIYVLYSQHIGKFDTFFHHTGWLHGIFSDDNGRTWSRPENIPVARSINDNPDTSFPPNMLCWQKPLRLGKDGKYFAGFTRWTSSAVRKNPTKDWLSHDARVEFMRFENVDENPAVQDLKIRWFAANEQALAVPYPGHPEVSACQEPSLVKLPDGRLFVVMRTASGSPFWSVSADGGETWAPPRRLLRGTAVRRCFIRSHPVLSTMSAATPPAAAVMCSSSTTTTAITRATARPTRVSTGGRSTSCPAGSRPAPTSRCGSTSRSSSWTTTA